MASLSAQQLSKRFGKLEVLKNINVSVDDGEFFVVLGPTAAGKTTTLKCLTGLLKPDGGSIKMDGADVGGLSPAERDVALVFQTYALYPRKTVFQNMAFPLQARAMSEADIKTRVESIAEKLQIKPYLTRKPAQLSGGQQQRVALGRAMVRDPQIFFMDEPLTNLDFKLRVEMRAELKRQQKELGKTFFYVTNDQVEAMSMADRIMVLNKGEVQQIGQPETIYEQPDNLFVARFVGNPRMNILECRVDSQTNHLVGDSWQLSLAGLEKRFNLKNLPTQLSLGIRAEDLSLSTESSQGALEGKVFVTEPLGDRTLVDVHIGSSTLKVREEPDFTMAEGSRVYLTVDKDRTYLFDTKTGKTLLERTA